MAAQRFSILCRALGYQPATVEKQILRGHFKPRALTTPGKARAWTARDVFALAIFEILFGAGLPPEEACQLSYLVPFGQQQWKVWPEGKVQPGAPSLLVWRIPGRWSSGWTHEIVNGDHFLLRPWLASKGISWALYVDLDAELNRAIAAIEAASQIETPIPPEIVVAKSRRQISAKRRPGPRS
ncbi:MAG: hypothetical protein ABSC37_19340 [Xanthobacteraceae bacterium]